MLSVKNSGGMSAFPKQLAIATNPTKTSYKAGESLDLTGLVTTVTYSDDSKEVVTTTPSMTTGTVIYEDTSSVTLSWAWPDDTDVTLTVELPIAVTRVLSSISLSAPTKTTYAASEKLDLTGAKVTATFNSGATEDVTSSAAFSPTNGSSFTSYGTKTVTATYRESGVTKTATTSIMVNYPVFGVSWNKSSSPKFSRTDDSAGFVDPSPAVGTGSGSSPFDSYEPWSAMQKETINGNVLVKIPKFYVKVTNSTSALSIKISMQKVDSSWKVSPAHVDRGDGKGERDYIYVGRYICNSSYKSASGSSPVVNITRGIARSNIKSKSTNCYQYDILTLMTIWCLYLVEFATWDSQSAIGAGVTNSSSAVNSGATDSMKYHTGTSGSSRTSSSAVQYRYIESLWGNVYQWVDGIYFSDSTCYVISNPAKYSESGGTKLSASRTTNPGQYISDFGLDSTYDVLVPTGTNGSKTTYVCDVEWSGGTVLCVGGGWDYGSNAGLFYWGGDYSASGAYSGIGARLVELP